ncbi:MAG TPA: hypothetical protein VKU02_26030 [Gemmataceae bacterium]|nr:hypothetical protein [Gemmataceae bacterium]
MSSPAALLVKRPSEDLTIVVVGDVYRFLATGEDTNGKYALGPAIVHPGGGLAPYVHSLVRVKWQFLRSQKRS